MKIEGSGSVPDPDPFIRGADPDPDPHQNVMDPEHRFFPLFISFCSGDVPVLREEVRAHPVPGGQEGLPLRSNHGISRCSLVAN
jgi:hypothetical protein